MQNDNSLKEKTMLITGATSGIGYAAARELAGGGAYIIGAGRSPERCQQAEASILAKHPQAKVTFLVADLSSLNQVRQLAENVRDALHKAGKEHLDVLVNNAAAVANKYTETEDGYELQFAVNHLAPFLLTHELLPILRRAPFARVITVSSKSHRYTRMRWWDVMHRRFYYILLAYKQSKLANVLFTTELNRRLGKNANLRAYAADPGLVNTQIGMKDTHGFANWFWDRRRRKGATTEKGAANVVYLASDASVEKSKEIYWKDCQPHAASRYSLRADEAARLWKLSEALCGIQFLSPGV